MLVRVDDLIGLLRSNSLVRRIRVVGYDETPASALDLSNFHRTARLPLGHPAGVISLPPYMTVGAIYGGRREFDNYSN